MDPETPFELKTDLAAFLKRDIDLVDLRRADTVTKAQVVATGDLLFSSDARAVFETVALSSYAILNEERREILEDIQRRGTIYG